MGKTKSKTQKQKRNLKRKLNNLKKQEYVEEKITTIKKTKDSKKPKLIEKNKVKYNVVLKNDKKTPNSKNNNNTTKKLKNNKNDKQIKQNKELTTTNPVIKVLLFIKNNIHILFNSLLLVIYIILIVALIKTKPIPTNFMIIGLAILAFFSIIAISYNKYISGKIFTIIISIGMGYCIYYLNYTYDFIRALNTSYYEYKTYYVITFNNNINHSIYSVNDKNIGLLRDNYVNVERMLNNKLSDPKYIVYEDINQLFEDFYNGYTRAIIVNQNQYIYLENNIENQENGVKKIYEFKVNSKK